MYRDGLPAAPPPPAPYQTEGEMGNNDRPTEALIKEKLEEFESRGYDMAIWAELCAEDDYNLLAW